VKFVCAQHTKQTRRNKTQRTADVRAVLLARGGDALVITTHNTHTKTYENTTTHIQKRTKHFENKQILRTVDVRAALLARGGDA
jgi:hypothetical protein